MAILRCQVTYMPIRIPTVLILATGLCWQSSAVAQGESGWVMPRTEHGQPDLQGLWSNLTLTPMERPPELGERRHYLPEEAGALEQAAVSGESARSENLDPDREPPPSGVTLSNEAEEAYSDRGLSLTRIDGEIRTSLIVDPANGRFPYGPQGRRADIYGQWRAQGFGPYDGPEMFPIGERCLAANGTMPPMAILPYNSNIQIVQNRDYVMILGEMVHDARIIPLNTGHKPDVMQNWFGDSVGAWEGDTLVVHTTHFRPENSNFRLTSSAALEVTEYFTRHSDREIFYRYVVEDPGIYTEPITVEMVLTHLAPGEQLYEFACHEGNYSMQGSLAGARREEQMTRSASAGTQEAR